MLTHHIVLDNGDDLVVRQISADEWACPVCGAIWPYAPISPVDMPGDRVPFALGDLCECHVEYGVDLFCHTGMFPGTFQRLVTKYRVQWLNRVGWTDSALRQLHDNLGITELQARRQANAVAKMLQDEERHRTERDDTGPKQP